MKTKLTTLSLITVFFLSGSSVYAQNNAHQKSDVTQNVKVYQVEKRLSDYTRPLTFTPTKAVPVNGAITENIVTTTQSILNKEAPFLKKGTCKTSR